APALEDRDFEAAGCEIAGAGEAVVAAADDHGVVTRCGHDWVQREASSVYRRVRSTPDTGRSTALLFAHSRCNDGKAAVDVGDLAGHCARKVGQQKRGDVADLADRDVASQRRRFFDEVEDLGESADA